MKARITSQDREVRKRLIGTFGKAIGTMSEETICVPCPKWDGKASTCPR